MSIDKIFFEQILQVLNVLGVLGATAFAALSAWYARNSVIQSREQDNPTVIVYVRQSPSTIHVVELVVKNEGVRSARDIIFQVKGQNIDVIHNRKIKDIGIIKNGISLLSGGREIVQPLDIFSGERNKAFKKSNISIAVTYTDGQKEDFADTFKLDFRGLIDLQIGTPNDEKAVRALQDINSELNDIKQDIKLIANKGIVPPMATPYYPDDSLTVTQQLGNKK